MPVEGPKDLMEENQIDFSSFFGPHFTPVVIEDLREIEKRNSD